MTAILLVTGLAYFVMCAIGVLYVRTKNYTLAAVWFCAAAGLLIWGVALWISLAVGDDLSFYTKLTICRMSNPTGSCP